MKKIYGIFIAASLLCSCEAFLDEKPLAEITRETTQTSELVSAYETAADAQLELNGAYAWLKCDMYEGIWFYIGECMSDNCYIGGDGISEEQLGNMKVTAVNSAVSLLWAQYYRALGTATSVIENVKLMPEDAISADDRARISAEVNSSAPGCCSISSAIGAQLRFRLPSFPRLRPTTSINGIR